MKQKNSTKDTKWWEGMSRKEYLAEMDRRYAIVEKEIDELFARMKEEEKAQEEQNTE